MAAEPMRIQRALARAGVASRRASEALVAAGRVTINGVVAMTGQSCDPTVDRITVDGKAIALPAPPRWLVLNKPAGTLTTRKDPEGRTTVFDLLGSRDVPGLTYVGRLDYMTEGLLLLTTDGDAAHKLTHPSTGVERTYVALVSGNAMGAAAEARRGVELDDGYVEVTSAVARPAGSRMWEFEVSIAEGRTHEIRRLCAALGLEVSRLVRTQYGPVLLGSLPIGETRPLTKKEGDMIAGLVAL